MSVLTSSRLLSLKDSADPWDDKLNPRVKEAKIKQRVTVLKDPTAIGMNMPYNFGIMRPHGFISQSNQLLFIVC